MWIACLVSNENNAAFADIKAFSILFDQLKVEMMTMTWSCR